MISAKDQILEKIRSATGGTKPSREKDYNSVPREYKRVGSMARAAIVECFIDRLHDYDSNVNRCADGEISSTIYGVLNAREINRLLMPSGLPPAWLPTGIDFVTDALLSYEAINAQRGVLTACAVGIALTGTIVLRHSEERRALTLIPDYHLCVVFEEQLVETVPEAIARMSEFSTAPITTISGPSATADIEMTRIKGVHGPRSLDIILVGSPVS